MVNNDRSIQLSLTAHECIMFNDLILKLLLSLLVYGLTSTALGPDEATRFVLTSTEPELGYRLPNDTVPLLYDLTLTTHFHLENDADPKKYRIEGLVLIHLKAEKSATKSITLHGYNLTIQRAALRRSENSIDQDPVQEWTGSDVIYDIRHEFIIFELDEELQMEEIYVLEVLYWGWLRTDGGLYHRQYLDAQGQEKWVLGTQFQAIEARSVFPCYDEPAIRANFQLTVGHSSKYSAISNMPVKSRNPAEEEGYVTTVFYETPLMQTYLLALVVSDFAFVGFNASTPQRVFARPEVVEKGEVFDALRAGVDLLKSLEEYFGVKYDANVPKLDQVAMPDHVSSAMENWGLVLYREYYLLWDEKTMPMTVKHDMVAIMSHELTHMFFGNLVAPKWWSYIWLNEGFARMYETLGVTDVYPEFDDDEMFLFEVFQRALTVEARGLTRPMTYYGESRDDVDDLFDIVAYSKSAGVLRTIKEALSEEVWRRGLTYYLEDMAHKAADSDDLARNLQRAVDEADLDLHGLTLKEILDSWSLNAGFPLVQVTLDLATNSLILSQTRFLNSEDEKPRFANNLDQWLIPVTVASASHAHFNDSTAHFWLSSARRTIQDTQLWGPYEWIVVNARFSGYYRVNYESELWQRLILKLRSTFFEEIHHHSRAQLLDDAFALTKAEKLDYSTLLRLLQYLNQEMSFLPWMMADLGLQDLNRLLEDSTLSEYFLRFVRELTAKIYSNYGLRDRGNLESLGQKFLRSIAIKWACKTQDPSCLQEANNRIGDVINGNLVEVEPNLQSALYCAAMRNTTDNDLNQVWQRMYDSNQSSVRNLLIDALSCTQHKQQRQALLYTTVIDAYNSYAPRERDRLMQSISKEGGVSDVIEFIDKDYEAIERLYGSRMSTRVMSLAEYVSSDSTFDQFKALLEKLRSRAKINADEEEAALTIARVNNEWLRKNEGEFKTFFEELYNGTSPGLASSLIAIVVSLMVSMTLTKKF